MHLYPRDTPSCWWIKWRNSCRQRNWKAYDGDESMQNNCRGAILLMSSFFLVKPLKSSALTAAYVISFERPLTIKSNTSDVVGMTSTSSILATFLLQATLDVDCMSSRRNWQHVVKKSQLDHKSSDLTYTQMSTKTAWISAYSTLIQY